MLILDLLLDKKDNINKMITLKSEPQDKYHIIEQGLQVYQQTLPSLLPFSFIAALFIFLPHFIYAFPALSTSPSEGQSPLVVTIFISWIIALVFLMGLIFRLYCICYQVLNTFARSLKHALSKLIPLLLLIVLYSLIILSGTMLLIIPGIILTVTLMFSFIILITDNQNILQNLTSSHRLVWGHWWHTLLSLSIPLLFNLAISFLFLFIVLSLSSSIPMSVFAIYMSMFVLNVIAQSFLIPLTFSIALVLFHDLKRRYILQQPSW